MEKEISIRLEPVRLPAAAEHWIGAGRTEAAEVDLFDFVPCEYEVAYSLLDCFPRGRFCEWGSGLGIVTGLAAQLGFQALGVELDGPLAARSRSLLERFSISAEIEQGDYFQRSDQAELYFVYCWPGRVPSTEAHFRQIAPPGARLLIYYGPGDIRCLQQPPQA